MDSHPTRKATGLTCQNCSKPVMALPRSTFTAEDWEVRSVTHCDCTLGFFKTNLSRAALQRSYWKGKSA